MGVQWDGASAFEKFSGPFDSVSVAGDQKALLFDQGMLTATLGAGTHTPSTVPALAKAGPGAVLVMVGTRPQSARFGSKGVKIAGGPMPGLLRHFGEFAFTIVQPDRFAMEVLGGIDPVAAAGKIVGKLLEACALEWIQGGYMTVADLAANQDKFRQTLGPHIQKGLEPLGLGSVELVDFVASVR